MLSIEKLLYMKREVKKMEKDILCKHYQKMTGMTISVSKYLDFKVRNISEMMKNI